MRAISYLSSLKRFSLIFNFSAMALHRCDIYGSKRAGNALKESLSLGASVAWPDVLFLLTGSRDISTQPLLEYYRPLIDWLEEKIDELDIPVGW